MAKQRPRLSAGPEAPWFDPHAGPLEAVDERPQTRSRFSRPLIKSSHPLRGGTPFRITVCTPSTTCSRLHIKAHRTQ
ncbi:MAG: hypothetical protein ABIP82_10110 [Nitrospirales bacterium]